LLLGLFTSSSYMRPPNFIPVLRHKVRRCLERSGFVPASHDLQALQRVLDSFPRDEMFQIDERQLFETALGILYLKQRPRIRLFVLCDPFERFVTCIIYMPRDRCNAEIGRRFTALLEQAFDGSAVTDSTTFDESALACLHLVLATAAGQASDVNVAEVERRLIEAARTWVDRLSESLVRTHGELAASALQRRFASAFPASYIERYTTQDAGQDIVFIERVSNGAPLALALTTAGTQLRLKTYHLDEPVALSDILPMLENLGVRVINEIPCEVTPRDGNPVWIQEFHLQLRSVTHAADTETRALFEEALLQVWSGVSEDDGFNRLVLTAGLSARQIVVLRAFCKFLRQAGSSFSQAYMENTMSAHPHLARQLVRLFETQFDPARQSTAPAAQEQAIHDEIVGALEQVENLDEDRILRGHLLLITKTLRTNYYQRDASGGPKPYLSIKLASREIDLLPLPRPLVEVFVYSPRMEGCHLRGGKVARGGIRWSDRKEDFRTEVLGLMKAQMVKNAVIVPVGSKGGFVVSDCLI
jgi:glutamate dehydrogenase